MLKYFRKGEVLKNGVELDCFRNFLIILSIHFQHSQFLKRDNESLTCNRHGDIPATFTVRLENLPSFLALHLSFFLNIVL